MKHTKKSILAELRRRKRSRRALSYRAIRRENSALCSAISYHFGSHQAALRQAGIEPTAVSQKPRWTKAAVIRLIKRAKRRGQSLAWSAVIARKDELKPAAMAAIRPRLFGSWDRALHAAGVDDDGERLVYRWNKALIAFELRQRFVDGEPVNSAAVRAELSALYAAALRHFGSFDLALRAAKIEPKSVRLRRASSR